MKPPLPGRMRRLFLASVVVLGMQAIAAPSHADVFGTFSNPAPITIPTSGVGVPFPSSIAVSGLDGIVGNVSITLTDFSHTFVDDVGILLVAPDGTSAIVFDGGLFGAATSVTLTFEDGGALWPRTGSLASGTYQPRSYYGGDLFPPPAPPFPGANPTAVGPSLFSIFDGGNPNGTWSLYVVDFVGGDGGAIQGGWSISITTVPEPGSLALLGIGTAVVAGSAWRRRRKQAASA